MGWKPMPRAKQLQALNEAGSHKSLPANDRVMGFQPMSYAPNSLQIAVSVPFAER